ncbi:MAG: hypothetical protein GKS06_16275 [Acidobacteria bacterium]|nr:hypothetical protein [Acidobacteriota bacterium]
MRRVNAAALLLAASASIAACAGEPEGEQRIKEIIDDLVAREYTRATSRYRMFEAEILAPAASPSWRRATDHSDETVREWAVDALWRIGLESDIDVVRARLDDPVRGVRMMAVDGLIQMAPEEAAAEFKLRLSGDAPEQVTLAASGLADMQDRTALPLLIERFQDPSLPESTRAALTQPMAVLGTAVVVAPLVDAALNSGLGTELRRLAAEAAFAAEAEGVGDMLMRLLDADDEYVRALADSMIER